MMVNKNRMPLEIMLNKTESAVPFLYDSDCINLIKFIKHKLHELHLLHELNKAVFNNS